MKLLKKTLIFCDHCPSLALAFIDYAPLCENHLLQYIEKVGGLNPTIKIEPLFKDQTKKTAATNNESTFSSNSVI